MSPRTMMLSCLMIALWSSGVWAADQTQDQLQTRDQDQLQTRDQDQLQTGDQDQLQTREQLKTDEPPIFGSQMMTEDERADYRARMRATTTQQEREQIRLEHHQQMLERARERGITLPDASLSGQGMGSGQSSGQGGGGKGGR